MYRAQSRVCVAALAVRLALAPLTEAKKKEKKKPLERFTANAVSMGTVGTGTTGRVEIGITRWTTDEERLALAQALVDGGAEAVVEALKKQESAGYIRFSRTLGNDLRFARQIEDNGSRRIILATDRPIGFGEAVRRGRSLDYSVTLVDLRVDPEGNGVGSMAIGVEVGLDREKGVLTLENYPSEPLRLQSVRKRK